MSRHESSPLLRSLGQRSRFIGQLESLLWSLCGIALIGVIVLLMPGGIRLQTPGPTPGPSPASTSQQNGSRSGGAAGRHREGFDLVEQTGTFRPAGDRIVFFSDDGRLRLVVLENLALQRVAAMLAANPEPLRWKVTGTLTEYRNVNYLLLRRVELISPHRPELMDTERSPVPSLPLEQSLPRPTGPAGHPAAK